MGGNNSKSGGASASAKQKVKTIKYPSPAERNVDFPHVETTIDTLQLEMEEKSFLALLEKLIGESEHVQNFPPALIPNEDKVIAHVLAELDPYTKANGGPLTVEKVTFTEGRSNVIITYEGKSKGTDKEYNIGFVGSHLDVVPADPETWERNPFKLSIEGDKLYGRGTTDCLGHIALVTRFFVQLAKAAPELNASVYGVFIASEENDSIPNVGIDMLVETGRLEALKKGTVLWIDASDSEPCMGTAGAIPWHMHVHGKRFHSGLPHKGINPIEMGAEALAYIQKRFYTDFKPVELERKYQFSTPSTMKPTSIKCASGSLNQIPPHVTISGDIRLTPFYDVKKVMAAVDGYVKDLNENIEKLPKHGPCSKYTLPGEGRRGKVDIEWASGDNPMRGIACDIDSPGFFALESSCRSVRGSSKPYSICGSLPLVQDMKEAGFDVQITGFGLSSTYHADNEYCLMSDMKNAFSILSSFISKLEAHQATL